MQFYRGFVILIQCQNCNFSPVFFLTTTAKNRGDQKHGNLRVKTLSQLILLTFFSEKTPHFSPHGNLFGLYCISVGLTGTLRNPSRCAIRFLNNHFPSLDVMVLVDCLLDLRKPAVLVREKPQGVAWRQSPRSSPPPGRRINGEVFRSFFKFKFILCPHMHAYKPLAQPYDKCIRIS